MEYLSQLENMLDSGHRLVSMETYDTDRVTDLLLELSRFSTRPYYLCEPNKGMYRLGASHITIPRTQSPHDLIEHIEASKHYGIFILKHYSDILNDEDLVEKLKNIATGNTHKVVLFLDEYIEIPRSLKPFTLRSKHQQRKTG